MQRTPTPERGHGAGPVFRQVAFTVEEFDRLKDFQRALMQAEGRQVSNSEAIGRLILANLPAR